MVVARLPLFSCCASASSLRASGSGMRIVMCTVRMVSIIGTNGVVCQVFFCGFVLLGVVWGRRLVLWSCPGCYLGVSFWYPPVDVNVGPVVGVDVGDRAGVVAAGE